MQTLSDAKPRAPKQEHSIPWFWPMAAGIELGREGFALFEENLKFVAEAERITIPPEPEWATPNEVVLELDTLRLREFGPAGTGPIAPVLVDAPYAGHSSTIADYARGQSLVETLKEAGLPRVMALDWKSATPEMAKFDIDKYLAELNIVADDLGGQVNLVGLCQGGWLSTMFAARFPGKVVSLVLAGSPIDTDAGDGEIKKLAHSLPMSFYEELVTSGEGLMLGRYMLAGWKNMHPKRQYVDRYIDLYEHIEDKNYIKRTEQFERWYENPINLPGRFYLQAIHDLFKENKLAKDLFVALGRRLSLGSIRVPTYLLAGKDDDITLAEQVFRARDLFGTPPGHVVTALAPGGHIGLFMGSHTLSQHWPVIGRWILENGRVG